MIPLPWRPTQSYLLWDLSSKDRNSLAVQKRALLALQEPGIWSLLDVDRVCILGASHVRLFFFFTFIYLFICSEFCHTLE